MLEGGAFFVACTWKLDTGFSTTQSVIHLLHFVGRLLLKKVRLVEMISWGTTVLDQVCRYFTV